MENVQVCQSCSMPLCAEEHIGTNADGSKNEEYCVYCFKDGAFTNNMTLEETIADSVNWAEEAGLTKEEMLTHAQAVLPTLKRWKCTCTDECASGYNPNCACTSSECHCTEKSN